MIHELAEKIFDEIQEKGYTRFSISQIVTPWIEEKCMTYGNLQKAKLKLHFGLPEKDPWCEHIDWRKSYRRDIHGQFDWYIHGGGWGLTVTSETKFCPICGKPRPENV